MKLKNMGKRITAVFVFLLFVIFVLCFSFSTHAIYSTADAPPFVVDIQFENREQLSELVELGFDLFEASSENSIGAFVSEDEYQYLVDQGFKVKKILGFKVASPFYPYYETYEEIKNELETIADNFPEIAEFFSIGDSWETTKGLTDRKLWALRITNKSRVSSKPKILYVGAHHAREVATPFVILKLAHLLTENYGQDAEITWLVDNREIVLLPLFNPDGYIKVEAGIPWRKNTNNENGSCGGSDYGIDLNRNYSFHWGEGGASTNPCAADYQGPNFFSEPETQAFRNFIAGQSFDILLSYHSFGRMLLYPWGYTSQPSPDDAVFKAIASKFTQENHYITGQAPHILYRTTGDLDDWAYGIYHIPSFTFEISKGSYPSDPNGFFPTEPELEVIWNDNRMPMILGAKLADGPYLHGLGPEIESISISGSTISVVTKSDVSAVEYFINEKGADGTGAPLSGSGTNFSGSLPNSGRFVIVGAHDSKGWGPPSIAFLTSTGVTPGEPTATPQPTSTITPIQTPTSTPTVLPTPSNTPTPVHDCPNQALQGDYDCNGEVNFQDFEKWQQDYQDDKADLLYFEFWRRMIY